MKVPLDKWVKLRDLDKEAPQLYFEVLLREGADKKHIGTRKLYYE
jgi:hypothetical protein